MLKCQSSSSVVSSMDGTEYSNSRIYENRTNIRTAKSYLIIRFMERKVQMTEKLLPKTCLKNVLVKIF